MSAMSHGRPGGGFGSGCQNEKEDIVMKKHGFRSIFSLLLAVMMVCSMLPTAAFAEGNVEEQPVVVETYTVTYTDGMGGAAFAEQKTEGLLYGDPTPAFAGDPALDGYTFTGWDKEIAETVTESVTYTAQWQAVPADVQPEVQSDVQPEADGNGEIDMQKGPDGRPPLNPDGGDRRPEHNKKLQISLYVDDGQSRTRLKTVNVDGNPEFGFAHKIAPLSDVAQGNNGKQGEVTSVTGDWTPNGSANEGDTVTWGHDAESGVVVYNVAPQKLVSGEKQTAQFQIVYLDDSLTTGYSLGEKWNEEFTCQYNASHSDTPSGDHSIACSFITGVKDRTSVNNGYQITKWGKGGYFSLNTQRFDFVNYNTTAYTGAQIIFLIAEEPVVNRTFILKFDANSGTGAPGDLSQTSDGISVSFNIPEREPTREGYTFKGWQSQGKYSNEIYKYGSSLSICAVSVNDTDAVVHEGNTHTRTLKAVWEEDAPSAPSKDEVAELYNGAVTVKCTNEGAGHGSKSYDLTMSDITSIGTPSKDSNGMYSCEVTIVSDRFVGMFNSETKVEHTPASDTKTVTLYYISGAWTAPSNDEGTIPIVFEVVCTATIPNPAADEFDDLKIQIKCDTKTDGSHDLQLSYKDGTYTFVRRDDPKYGFVVFTPSTYLDTYNKTHPGHTLKYPNGAVTWEFEYKDGGWQRRVTDKLPTIYVVCPNEPVAPKKPNSDEIKELLPGEVVKLYHQSSSQDSTCVDRTYQLMDGTFEVGDVSGDAATGYTCSVTVKAEAYLAEYNKVSVKSHSLAAEETGIETITLTWNTDGDNGRWVVQTETPVVFNVVCEATPPTDKPAAPAYNTIKNLTVKVVCPTHGYKEYGVVPAGLTAGEVQEQNGDYFCTVTIKSDAYVNGFNTKLGVEHTPKSEEKQVLLKYEAGVWVPNEPTDSPVVFNVSCTTQGKPTEETIINDLGSQVVGVVCTTMPNVHAARYSALREGTFDISDVTTVNGLPSCTITIHAETYVSAFNNSTEVIHQLKYPDVTSKTLQLYYTDGKWTALDGTTPVVFEVVRPTAPVDVPTEEQIKAELGKIQVKCVTEGSGHAVKEYDTSVGGYTAVTMQDKDGKPIYTVTITVPAQRYIEKYNEETGKTHQLASGEKAEKTVVLRYADKQWTLVEGTLPVSFNVTCGETKPAAPNADQVDSQLNVKVNCANMSAAHQKDMAAFVYETLLPGSFSIGEVTGDALSGYSCVITVRLAQYLQDFNTRSNATHTPTDGTEKAVKLYYLGGGWSVGTGSGMVEFTVTCETVPAQKYTVTYTDGVDGVEVFKDQVYADLTAGTATPAFNGTPTRVGYVFAGWNPAVAATVTGNATYAATWKVDSNNNGKPDDEELRYTVTYVDGANGKAFASQVYTGLLSGTATPKFNGTPLRSGYVFIGWSPVWSGTVTGNVTYTATWSTITGGLDPVPKTGDNGLTLALSALVLFSFCGATACVISTKKRG